MKSLQKYLDEIQSYISTIISKCHPRGHVLICFDTQVKMKPWPRIFGQWPLPGSPAYAAMLAVAGSVAAAPLPLLSPHVFNMCKIWGMQLIFLISVTYFSLIEWPCLYAVDWSGACIAAIEVLATSEVLATPMLVCLLRRCLLHKRCLLRKR